MAIDIATLLETPDHDRVVAESAGAIARAQATLNAERADKGMLAGQMPAKVGVIGPFEAPPVGVVRDVLADWPGGTPIIAIGDHARETAMEELAGAGPMLASVPPFIDANLVRDGLKIREQTKARLEGAGDIPAPPDPDAPWLVVWLPSDRQAGEQAALLANALGMIGPLPWRLLVLTEEGSDPTAVLASLLRFRWQLAVRAVSGPADRAALACVADIAVVLGGDAEDAFWALDAQACGVPVVAPRQGLCPEVIVEGATGRLFTPNNFASLANGIGFLIRHPDFRSTMAGNGPNTVLRAHDSSLMVPAFVTLFESSAGL